MEFGSREHVAALREMERGVARVRGLVRVSLNGGGEATLPWAQVDELHRLALTYPGSTWHMNDCGCCACLHPGGDTSRGWIVNEDGLSTLHVVEHGHVVEVTE